jgi:phage shock protein B
MDFSQNDFQIIELALIVGLVALIALGTFLLIAIRMLQGGSRKKREARDEETQMIQEIYQGLRRMEQRVEALETILVDPDKGGTSHGP